jgi:hypothetical protein
VLELAKLAEDAREAGDRVALVAFGANAAIEELPQRDARFAGFQRSVDRDGSDLGGALDAALALIPDDREGALLLVSDGESNGRDPLAVARSAFARGVRIDVRPLARGSQSDVAVERLDLPEEVGAAEPFQFGAWVRSDVAIEASYVLERDGEELARGTKKLEPGLNRFLFRDRVARAGVARYRLRLEGVSDRTPENDIGLGALRVSGQRPVLVVNDDGLEDTLAHALRQAAIPVEVAAPESARLDRVGLTAFRAVILENISAERVGSNGTKGLREYVLERGGGLLMTGGRASFGMGGWYLSPVDELLPVSMEMRQENRKVGVALAISMDRSGSMAVEVSPGVPKMQLADLGACAAIELLSPLDSVGVIAVDSTDHIVQALTPVRDVGSITANVRRIDSGAAGIYCYTALLAAGKMLEDAAQRNRHVILFADANDSEEQEKCPELVERFQQMGITLSVVALGTEHDSDAEFLKRIAALGGGQCYFTNDPSELPRLFAQDTLTIARETFVDTPAATAGAARSVRPRRDRRGETGLSATRRLQPHLAARRRNGGRRDARRIQVAGLRLRVPRPRTQRELHWTDRRRIRRERSRVGRLRELLRHRGALARGPGGARRPVRVRQARRPRGRDLGRGRSAREHADRSVARERARDRSRRAHVGAAARARR